MLSPFNGRESTFIESDVPASSGRSAFRSPPHAEASNTLTMSAHRFINGNLNTLLGRRDFLLGVAGVGGAVLTGSFDDGHAQVPMVHAEPTVFFSHPDGRTALVRFIVLGSDAAGGRLRVFDQARRQIGTAGMIGYGGRLYGELWLPLDRVSTVYTDLELPGVRGVVRSVHRIQPKLKWTLRWVTLADPAPLDGAEYQDHAAFLRSIQFGPGPEPGAVILEPTGSGAGLSSLPLFLTGIGVRWVVRRNAAEGAPGWMRARDGSSVTVISVPPGGTPDALGLFTGGDEMTRRVERFIESSASLQPPGQVRPEALVAGSGPDDFSRSAEILDSWNARYAYPRIVVGRLDDLVSAATSSPIRPAAPRATPDAQHRAAVAAARETERRARVDRLLAPLVARLNSTEAGLPAVASQFAFRVPGTLVFNPAPFSRSDVAVMPDGTERVVTDIPGNGYVCVPYPGNAGGGGQGQGRWTRGGDELVLRNSFLTVRVDLENGAIRSARGANDREWVGSRGPGWNAAAGYRLGDVTPERNPLVGQRLTLQRTGPAGARLTTTITMYDTLPWVDIRNELVTADSGADAPAYAFPFALNQPRLSWEIPAGFETGVAPVAGVAHLRWIKLESSDDVVYFRGLDAPDASVEQDGMLTSFAPAGVSRYRLGFASRFSHAEDAWRFGWSTEPLVTAAVPGTGRAALASYGSMILVDQSGIAIVDFRAARDGNGVIVLLQDVLGASRDITLGPGLLAFTGGRRVDFLERDRGALPDLGGRGISVPISGYGLTMVRLTGVGLAGG